MSQRRRPASPRKTEQPLFHQQQQDHEHQLGAGAQGVHVDESCAGRHGPKGDQFPRQAAAQAGEQRVVGRRHGLEVLHRPLQDGLMDVVGEQDISPGRWSSVGVPSGRGHVTTALTGGTGFRCRTPSSKACKCPAHRSRRLANGRRASAGRTAETTGAMAWLKNQRRRFTDRHARIIRAKGLDVSRARRNPGASSFLQVFL